MEAPLMLWVDCLSGPGQRSLVPACERVFRLLHTRQPEQLDSLVTGTRPSVICFDFDRPTETQLGAMQAIKRRHAGIPVLMLTVEHSEALAVWSFRARIWNYLVKPVAAQEWRANLQVLARIAALGPRQRRELRLPGPAVETVGQPRSRDAAMILAMQPAIAYVERHFSQPVRATEVARLCGLSPFRFSREFHRAVGHTFQDYLLRHRIRQACRMIRESPERPLADIGAAAGFNDSSYFARMFRRYTGLRPSEYQRTASLGAGLPVESSLDAQPLDVPLRPAASVVGTCTRRGQTAAGARDPVRRIGGDLPMAGRPRQWRKPRTSQ
jgi:AraC-like DNA-binding protein